MGKITAAVVLAVLAAVGLSGEERRPPRQVTAQEMAIVVVIGRSLGFEESLVREMVESESSGNVNALGPAGWDGARCRGLLQINPRFQDELVRKHFPHPASTFDVWDP